MTKKKAFTIVEMMVVMSIIAILATLGVSALLNANKASMVDAAAEDLLARIRETQNRSISIKTNKSGKLPYVWSLKVRQNGYDVVSYDNSGASQSVVEVAESITKTWNNISVAISHKNGQSIAQPLYVNYTTPFGRVYALDRSCVGACWKKNVTQTGDFSPSGVISQFSSEADVIQFNISLNGKYSRIVNLNSSGDTWLE